MSRHSIRSVVAAGAAALVLTGVAVAGPPWISIEYPANPHDPVARGAFMTVRTYHHGDLIAYDLTGTAEGLVNGQRRSQRLDIRRMSQPGTYAVRWQKPSDGTWVLVVSSSREGAHAATAVVSIGGDGRVAAVNVPTGQVEGGRWHVPRAVTASEIDVMLRRSGTLVAR